jgi:hypothetical protein
MGLVRDAYKSPNSLPAVPKSIIVQAEPYRPKTMNYQAYTLDFSIMGNVHVS